MKYEYPDVNLQIWCLSFFIYGSIHGDLIFLFINLVSVGGRPLEIVSDLSMGDLRSRKILYLAFKVSPGNLHTSLKGETLKRWLGDILKTSLGALFKKVYFLKRF